MNPAKVILENGLGGAEKYFMLVSLKKVPSPCAGTLQEGGNEDRGRQSQGLVAVLRAGVNRPVDVDATYQD